MTKKLAILELFVTY